MSLAAIMRMIFTDELVTYPELVELRTAIINCYHHFADEGEIDDLEMQDVANAAFKQLGAGVKLDDLIFGEHKIMAYREVSDETVSD